MSDGEVREPRDPVEVLNGALDDVPDDVIARAYVTRTGGPRRIIIGKGLALRRDMPVFEQIVAYIQATSHESGIFEVKVKAPGNLNRASATLPLELPPFSERSPDRFRAETEGEQRLENPAPAPSIPPPATDPFDSFIAQTEKLKRLKRILLDDEDDAKAKAKAKAKAEDEEEDDEEDEEAAEPAATSLLNGAAEYVSSEGGKAMLARMANGLCELIDAGVEVRKKQAELLGAQAAGKVPAFAGAARKEPKASREDEEEEDDDGEQPEPKRVVKMIRRDDEDAA